MKTITVNIQGDKVHGVGYRPFLYAKALRLKILYFDAENTISEDGKKNVVVSVSGSDKQLLEFLTYIKENRPENAKVDSISELIPVKNVISIEDYIKILHSEQLYNMAQAWGGKE